MPWDTLACSLFRNKRPYLLQLAFLIDKWCSHAGSVMFPRWEQMIPTLGIKYSHVGNKQRVWG